MKRRRVLPALGVLLVALAAAGATLAGAATKAASDTLVIVSPVGVPSLDREAFGTGTQQEVISNLMEPLLRFKPNYKKDAQGISLSDPVNFVPGVCVKFSFSADKKRFTCTLGNAKSQYGNEITSADVKWTFDYIAAAKNIGVLLQGIISIDAKNPVTIVDDKTFTINLTERNTVFLPAMTFFFFNPYDSVEAKKHATAKDPFARQWLTTHSAGFGPYMVTSFDPNKEVRMAVNPNFVGSPGDGVVLPAIKNIVYRAVPDNGTRAQLLQSGAAHLAKSVDLGMYPVLKDSKTVATYNFPYNALVVLFFNNKMKPFDNANLRKAIACGIDRAAISQKTFYGVFPVAHSIITTKIPESTPQYDGCRTQNVAKAKQYLKAAGYPNGTEVTLYYSKANSGQDAQDNATLVQGQLAQVGIKVNLKEEPDATKYFVAAITHEYPMHLFTIGSNVPDVGWHLSAWFGPGGVLNFDNVDSPELKRLVGIIKTTPALSAQRTRASHRFQQIVMSNQQVVPIVYIVNQYVVHKSVCNLQGDPGDFTYWNFLTFCKK